MTVKDRLIFFTVSRQIYDGHRTSRLRRPGMLAVHDHWRSVQKSANFDGCRTATAGRGNTGLEPFWHGQLRIALLKCQNGPFWHGQLHYLSARMARAILAWSIAILYLISARMARRPVALLKCHCQNGSSHSAAGKASCRMAKAILARPVAEWFEQFWHGQLLYLSIMQNGSSHSGTENRPCQNGSHKFIHSLFIRPGTIY